MKLLTTGTIGFDTITTPFGQADEILGGSVTYCSLAASYFTEAGIVAVAGEDFTAEHEQIFTNKKISTEGLSKLPGQTFRWGGKYSFDLNNRETLFTHLNVLQQFDPVLPENYKTAEFVFLGNLHPNIQQKVLGQLANPKFVGLDTMNYWIEKTPAELSQVLGKIHGLIINEGEARELTHEYNIHKAAKKILGMMRPQPSSLLVIKCGEYGALVFQNQNFFSLPAFPLEEVFDPTGAGDSFAGAFMGYLASTANLNWDNIKRACVAGSVLASFCVEKMGTEGLTNIPEQEIKNRLSQFKQVTDFEVI